MLYSESYIHVQPSETLGGAFFGLWNTLALKIDRVQELLPTRSFFLMAPRWVRVELAKLTHAVDRSVTSKDASRENGKTPV